MTLPKANQSSGGIQLVRFNTVARELGINPRTLTRIIARGHFPPPVYLGRHKVYEAPVAEAAKRKLLRESLVS